eukprot:1110300-Pleurochrysis_carterae.AAC.1
MTANRTKRCESCLLRQPTGHQQYGKAYNYFARFPSCVGVNIPAINHSVRRIADALHPEGGLSRGTAHP